jgi:predicted ATPase
MASQRTLEALKGVIMCESQVQPVLLLVEDLHWIDTETQAVLDTLVDSLPIARLLLLVTYRPEYQHGWGSKTSYAHLRLDPLPSGSAEALLHGLLGEDPGLAPLTPRLIARTEGNPFFLEESVRTLVETGGLVGEPGAYHLAQALPSLQVPATVQVVLAARIDRLPPEAKALLHTAAVIGLEIPVPLLHTLAELSEDVLHRGLTHLQAAEFLYETRLFPEPAYTFTHALTQQVAYDTLPQGRQRALHARLVAALEALAPERVTELTERLAYHARRGEVWDKAVTYGRQAGEKARNSGAPRKEVTRFEQALDALGHLPEHPDTGVLGIELHYRLGGLLSSVGEHARSLALLGEAEARARQLDDRARLGWVLARMVTVHCIVGDVKGAMAAGRQALELADMLRDPTLHVHAAYHLGQLYTLIGNYRRAAEVLRGNAEALARSTPGIMRDRCIRSQAWLAEVLSILGEFAEGRRHGEEALRLAMEDGQWHGDAPITARARLGCLYLAQGDLEAAIQVFEEGLALCRTSGHRAPLWAIAGGLGEAYAHTGRLAEGLAFLEEARRDDLRTGALGSHYSTHLRQLSAVYLLAGRFDEAWQHAYQALDLARQHGARGNEAFALCQLGAVHAQANPPDVTRSEAHSRQALTLADELGMRPLVTHCHRGLGTLYAKLGWREQARAELSIAIDLYRSMAMTFWLPQAETALAEVEEP